jgi:hypothetical protein
LWFGCANGDIYTRSQDDPTADETLITNLSDSITDIYVGEAFSDPDLINHVIAAHGTSASWTHNAGNSWQSHNFGNTTGIVAIDPFLPTHMFTSAGTTMYETWDDGGTWTPLLSVSSGTIGDFAAAPWDTAIVSTSGEIVFLSENTWSASLSGTPQTITPKVTTEAFVVATDDGSLYLFTKNEGTYDVTAIGQTDDTSGNTERIVRDGEHPIVFFADATGVGKQVNDDENAIYLIDNTDSALRVGYAGLGVFDAIPAPPTPPGCRPTAFGVSYRTFVDFMGESRTSSPQSPALLGLPFDPERPFVFLKPANETWTWDGETGPGTLAGCEFYVYCLLEDGGRWEITQFNTYYTPPGSDIDDAIPTPIPGYPTYPPYITCAGPHEFPEGTIAFCIFRFSYTPASQQPRYYVRICVLEDE